MLDSNTFSSLEAEFFDVFEANLNFGQTVPTHITAEQNPETSVDLTKTCEVYYGYTFEGSPYEIMATVDVTFIQQCVCQDYAFTPLSDMTSVFGDPLQQAGLVMPGCSDS